MNRGEPAARPARMTDEEAQAMRRENAYLKQRCAQLGDDVADLAGQLLRTRRQLERLTPRPPSRPA